MIEVRKSAERGHVEHGWLDARHTFSFGSYLDARHMGFRALRVINEDRVQPGAGFPTHPHRDMEIVSWVLEGALEHRDSLGNGSVVRPGDAQRMSAGTGVMHSEFNPLDEPMRLLQIWILPERTGLEPSWEQKHFSAEERADRLCLLASHDAREGSALIHRDVDLFVSDLRTGTELNHALRPDRHAWIQVARGALTVNGVELREGDGASVSGERRIALAATADAHFLLFDLD